VRRIRMWSHWSGGVIIASVACALCAGIGVTVASAARSSSFPAATRDRARTVADATRARRAALMSALSFRPAPGAVGVTLDAPVVVQARTGRLISVRATTATGMPIAGRLTAAGRRWLADAPLLPRTTYRVTATVAAAGLAARLTSTFQTLTPAASVGATIFPGPGLSVGVAQPIVIRFDHFITNGWSRAAVLSHLTVTESMPVPGGWHWFSDDELHFRPQGFWPSGEKVTVVSDLAGWSAGDGLWGEGVGLSQFTIGDARVSIANLATHEMTVTDNGKVIATYPFSGGREDDPTMNGVHIVLDRSSVVRMISSTNGIPVNSPDGYDELVYSDVHISDSGEYVHAAPWSVAAQGHRNVSHGCINLSPADALTFMGFSRVGDVVWVVGGPRPPAPGDHGVMDWDTPWSDWTPAVVHGVTPPPAKPKAKHPPVAHPSFARVR